MKQKKCQNCKDRPATAWFKTENICKECFLHLKEEEKQKLKENHSNTSLIDKLLKLQKKVSQNR